MEKTREALILERYEEWDPSSGETVDDIAAEFGISRQRLFQILKENKVVPKTRRRQGDSKWGDELLDRMAENALAFLLQELEDARAELREYRKRYGPL